MAPFRLVLTAALLPLASLAAPPKQTDSNAADSYDIVVVGGGTAGNAVAARLSQRLPDSTVLVIEAGPFAPDEDRINIPGLKGSTLGTVYVPARDGIATRARNSNPFAWQKRR